VFFVPGFLAAAFGWLGILTATTGTSVELSQATMWDMVQLRTEQEYMRNVFRGGDGRAELAYDYRQHGEKQSMECSITLVHSFCLLCRTPCPARLPLSCTTF
jgi:hypothetical protein